MEQCNDLLERPPNNSFTMRNFQCPKQPLLDQLHIDMPGGGGGGRGGGGGGGGTPYFK